MNFNPFDKPPHCIESLNLKRDPTSFNDFPFIIGINKPAGITSFDCIRRMRPRIFENLGKGKGRRKLKIGHFGTLDPFADGVLLVGTGRAMRLMGLVQSSLRKHYSAVCEFGKKTITGDLDGEIIENWKEDFDADLGVALIESLEKKSVKLKEEYLQVPPYFSAVKHEGKPLYEYARSGIYIEKEAVPRKIYELSIQRSKEEFHYKMDCSVSSGTYIRGLWQDLLVDFQKMGHLKSLCRVAYGGILQSDCVDLEEFCINSSETFKFIWPWEVLKLPIIELSQKDAGAFLQGAFLSNNSLNSAQNFWALFEGYYIGLGECFEDKGVAKMKAQVNFY